MAYVFSKINQALGLPDENPNQDSAVYEKNVGTDTPEMGASNPATKTSPNIAGNAMVKANQRVGMPQGFFSGVKENIGKSSGAMNKEADTYFQQNAPYVRTGGESMPGGPSYSLKGGEGLENRYGLDPNDLEAAIAESSQDHSYNNASATELMRGYVKTPEFASKTDLGPLRNQLTGMLTPTGYMQQMQPALGEQYAGGQHGGEGAVDRMILSHSPDFKNARQASENEVAGLEQKQKNWNAPSADQLLNLGIGEQTPYQQLHSATTGAFDEARTAATNWLTGRSQDLTGEATRAADTENREREAYRTPGERSRVIEDERNVGLAYLVNELGLDMATANGILDRSDIGSFYRAPEGSVDAADYMTPENVSQFEHIMELLGKPSTIGAYDKPTDFDPNKVFDRAGFRASIERNMPTITEDTQFAFDPASILPGPNEIAKDMIQNAPQTARDSPYFNPMETARSVNDFQQENPYVNPNEALERVTTGATDVGAIPQDWEYQNPDANDTWTSNEFSPAKDTVFQAGDWDPTGTLEDATLKTRNYTYPRLGL